MIDDVSDILEYYNRDIEHEDIRLERHQLEHDLTWRYLARYLPAEGPLLEVGAATGRYTLELARRGYAVTAVDLSEVLLARGRQRLEAAGLAQRVRLVVSDARQLSSVTERDFRAVLLMGPLYHLVVEADRQAAVQAAYDRLVPGGMILSAFISRYGLLCDLLVRMPEWIERQDEVRAILEIGRDPDHPPGGGFRGYFARPSEIEPLHAAAGFQTIALAGVEPAIAADDESYNRLQGTVRQRWLDLLFAISSEPCIVGASRHLLYVGQKPAT
jgi:S-adenosylmethionine-dependent methyltransferase